VERYLYISPAIVALIIFVYMRKQQAKRNDKMRQRFWKNEEKLVKRLSAGKEVKQNNKNGN